MGPTVILYLTITIIAIITLLTIYALTSKNLRMVNAAPSVLTSFGIFGTFLGITIGLFGFDPTNAGGSLPHLFDGIRLAFWTSVAGILGALLVKLRFLFRPGLLTGAEIARRDNRRLMEDLVVSMKNVESGINDPKKSSLLAGINALQAKEEGGDNQLSAALADIRGVLGDLHASLDATGQRDNAMLATVQAMGETSSATLKELQSGTTAVLREAQRENAASLEAMQQGSLSAIKALQEETSSTLKNVQHDSAAAITALAQGSTAEMRELQQRSAAELSELVANSGNQFKQLSDTLNGNQEALLTGLQASAMLLDEFRNFQADSTARMQALQEDIGAHLASTMTSGVERIATEFQNTMLGESGVAESIAKEFSGSQEMLASTLAAQNAANLEKLEKLQTGIATMGTGVAAATAGLGNALAEQNALNIEKLDQLGAGIAAISSGFSAASGDLTGALAEQSAASMEKLDQLSTGMAAIGAGVAAATAGLSSSLAEQSGASLAKLDNLNEGIESLGRSISTDIGAVSGSLGSLNELNDGIQLLTSQVASSFGDLEKGLAGDGNSLATRIMDTIDDLRYALVGPDAGSEGVFKSFAEAQAETREALEQIRLAVSGGQAESNKALAALNDAVTGFDSGSGAIIEAMRETQSSSTESMSKLGDAVAQLNTGAMSLGTDMQKAQANTIKELQGIRRAVQDNTAKQQASPKALMKALEETVKQFNSQFSGQFWDKFGAFNEGMGELIEWMETYRKQISDTLDHQTKAAANMDIAARRLDDISQHAQMFTDISRSLGGLLTGIDSQRVEMEGHLKRFSHIVDETANSLANIELKIIEGNQQTNRHVSDISERIEEQVIRLDHALDDELTKALNTFGRQLAALSEKFVEDYTPLTERLRDVVNIARAS